MNQSIKIDIKSEKGNTGPFSGDKKLKAKDWCFTWNNYPKDEAPVTGAPQCSYLVCQEEKGEVTGNLHWQGYAEFNNPITLKTAQKRLGIEGAHMEYRRGTPQQASNYCKKDTFIGARKIEWGTIRPGQGARTDIKECMEDIGILNKVDLIIKWGYTYARSRGTMEEMRNLVNRKKAYEIKERKFLYDERPSVLPEGGTVNDVFFYEGNWNGYGGEKFVVMDEEGNEKLIEQLQKNKPTFLNVKYGGEWLIAKYFYINKKDRKECDCRPKEGGGIIWCDKHNPY